MVEHVMVREGAKVNAGDTILTFNTASIDAKIRYQQEIAKDYADQIADLTNCTRNNTPSSFHSPKRQQEALLYERQQDEINLRVANADKKLNRNKPLYQSGAIAEDEYENYVQEKEKSTKELRTLTENRLSAWKSDLNQLQNSLNEATATLNQLYRERKMYTIQAPVNGTLDQFSGIYQGAFLQSGQSIASISPDSTLLIESYVLPKDIGFLYKGMPVNVQVESFNYNQWGMVHGKIIDISSDFIISNNTAYYKVKCAVAHTFLEMKSGQRGYLKKGMTVQTRFMITKRTLLQLLYQKFDDWANPAIRTSTQNSTQQASLVNEK
jgi:HlyD family secretion protein